MAPWFGIPGQALFHSLTGGKIKTVIVNPFPAGEKPIRPGGEVLEVEFEALGKGFIPQFDTFRERVFEMVGPEGLTSAPRPPKSPLPGKVYGLISEAVGQLPVRAVYHCEVEITPGQMTPLIGVELSCPATTETTDRVMTAIAKSLASYEDPDFGLDLFVVPVDDVARFRAAIKPFYLRDGA